MAPTPSTRRVRDAAIATFAAGALSVSMLAVSPANASTEPLSITYSDCTEYIGLEHIDRSLVAGMLPADFDLVYGYGDFLATPPSTQAVIIVRSVTCKRHEVNGEREGHVNLAQVGVITALTDAEDLDAIGGTGLDNFQLEFVTDSRHLAAAMNGAGVPTVLDRHLDVDIDVDDDGIEVEIEADGRQETEGDLVSEATFPSPFIAHWWGRNGNVDVRSQQVIDLMQFHLDFTGDVSVEAAPGGVLGSLFGVAPVAYDLGIVGEIPVGNVTIGPATPGTP